MTLTGPFIDDVAPPGSKGRWFAWLSLTPTLGVALGYELGNLTQYMSWRILFYIEAGVAVPIILFCLLAPAVRLRGKLTQVSPEGGSTRHLAAVRLPHHCTCVLCYVHYSCTVQPSTSKHGLLYDFCAYLTQCRMKGF